MELEGKEKEESEKKVIKIRGERKIDAKQEIERLLESGPSEPVKKETEIEQSKAVESKGKTFKTLKE